MKFREYNNIIIYKFVFLFNLINKFVKNFNNAKFIIIKIFNYYKKMLIILENIFVFIFDILKNIILKNCNYIANIITLIKKIESLKQIFY